MACTPVALVLHRRLAGGFSSSPDFLGGMTLLQLKHNFPEALQRLILNLHALRERSHFSFVISMVTFKSFIDGALKGELLPAVFATLLGGTSALCRR